MLAQHRHDVLAVDQLELLAERLGERVEGAHRPPVLVAAAEPGALGGEALAPGIGRGEQHQPARLDQAARSAETREEGARARQPAEQVGGQHRVEVVQLRGQGAGVGAAELDPGGLGRGDLGAARRGQLALDHELVVDRALLLDLLGGVDEGGRDVDAGHLAEVAGEAEAGAAHPAAHVDRLVPADAELAAPLDEEGRAAFGEGRGLDGAQALGHRVRGPAVMQQQVLVEHRRGVVGAVAALLAQQDGAGIGLAGCGLDDVEARVLEEMRAEVEARPDRGLVARADEGAAQDHRVLAVEAGGGEVVVIGVYLEGGERVEVVLAPVPDVAGDVVDALRARLRPGHRRLRAEGEVEVGGVALGQFRRVEPHHRVLDPRAGGAVGAPRRVAQPGVLGLGGQPVGLAVALGLPRQIRLGLVEVDADRPVLRHVDDLENGAQLVGVLAGRPVGDPEGRPFAVAELAPLPARRAPEALLVVAALLHEVEEGAVGHHLGRDLEGVHGRLALAILVVPAIARPVGRLADHHVAARDFGHRVGDPGAVRLGALAAGAVGVVQVGPGVGPAQEGERQFAQQHG